MEKVWLFFLKQEISTVQNLDVLDFKQIKMIPKHHFIFPLRFWGVSFEF